MAMEILTKEDLEEFKQELFKEIKSFFIQEDVILNNEFQQSGLQKPLSKVWLKSHEVQKLLRISESTLQTLRKNGVLPFTKFGKTFFYNQHDIQRILDENLVCMKYKTTENEE